MQYPTKQVRNMRYRGPMESSKVNNFAGEMYGDLSRLYERFQSLQGVVDNMTSVLNQGDGNYVSGAQNVSTSLMQLNTRLTIAKDGATSV